MSARPRAKSWPPVLLNALRNCVALHMPSFQLFPNNCQKCQNWYDFAAYRGGWGHAKRQRCAIISSCLNRKLYHNKIDCCVTVTLYNNFLRKSPPTFGLREKQADQQSRKILQHGGQRPSLLGKFGGIFWYILGTIAQVSPWLRLRVGFKLT